MKVTLAQTPGAHKEVVIRYDTMDDEIRALLELLGQTGRRLYARDGDTARMLDPADVLYFESVDEHTFAYTAGGVFGVPQPLSALAERYAPQGFFRCSKSMAVNLRRIESFKGGDYGRVFAMLENGEKILVSRRYAKALRETLKGE
jgi:DNA-binding LytR/AlgR family response regulator